MKQAVERLNIGLARDLAADPRYDRLRADYVVKLKFPNHVAEYRSRSDPSLMTLWSVYDRLWVTIETDERRDLGAGMFACELLSEKSRVNFGLVIEDSDDRIAMFEAHQNDDVSQPSLFIVFGSSLRAFDVLPTLLALVQ